VSTLIVVIFGRGWSLVIALMQRINGAVEQIREVSR